MKRLLLAFTLLSSLICYSQPANDNPCGAITLTVQTGSYCTPSNAMSWTGATATTGIPAPGCANYLTGDIWFKFTGPVGGAVIISTAEGTGGDAINDGGMAVYSNAGTCNTLTFSLVECDDDDGPGNMPYLAISVTPGAVYYIRFWDFFGATSANFGGICVTDPNPPLATSGGVGVGIQNPDKLLDVNGQIKIRGGGPGPGKILISDANGVAFWSSPPINPIPFKATNNSNQGIPSGSRTLIGFNNEEYDDGSNFNGISFVSPATGVYHFDAAVYWSLSGITGGTTLSLGIYMSGVLVNDVDAKILAGTSGGYSQMLSTDLFVPVGQNVTIQVSQTSGSVQQIVSDVAGVGKFSYFNGHRIR